MNFRCPCCGCVVSRLFLDVWKRKYVCEFCCDNLLVSDLEVMLF